MARSPSLTSISNRLGADSNGQAQPTSSHSGHPKNQQEPKPESATKHLDVLAYHVLLHRAYRVPVHSSLPLLRSQAEHPNLTAAYILTGLRLKTPDEVRQLFQGVSIAMRESVTYQAMMCMTAGQKASRSPRIVSSGRSRQQLAIHGQRTAHHVGDVKVADDAFPSGSPQTLAQRCRVQQGT